MASSRARNPPSPVGPRGLGHGAEGYRHALEQNATVGQDPYPIALDVPRGRPRAARPTRSGRRTSSGRGTTPSSPPSRCARNSPTSSWPWAMASRDFREEFYRHKFPAELFDYAGLEAGGGYPESQPPGGGAVNVEIWMERQLLDSYGYKDKAGLPVQRVVLSLDRPEPPGRADTGRLLHPPRLAGDGLEQPAGHPLRDHHRCGQRLLLHRCGAARASATACRK